jgi:predicted small lipoprotein YifL
MMRGLREGSRVTQTGNAGLARIAVVAALVAALGLAGCGRKTGLDPPPSAETPTPRRSGAATPDPSGPPQNTGLGPDGRPIAAPAGAKRPIPWLDWLIQ